MAQAFGTVRRCDNCCEHKIAVFDGGIGADRSGASGLKTAQKTTFGSDLKVGFKVVGSNKRFPQGAHRLGNFRVE